MKVILKKNFPGLGKFGKIVSVAPDRARRLVLGGLGDYVEEDLPKDRKKAIIEVPEKRGRKKKK